MKTLLKFTFAIGLVVWLIQSGRLDFGLVKRALTENAWWPLAVFVMLIDSMISALRWRALLMTKTTQFLSRIKIFKMTWIGMFFNTFLPGSVSGDLIKLIYAKDLDPKLPKTFLLMSTLLDRVLGLMGLIIVMTLMTGLSLIIEPESIDIFLRFLPFNLGLFTIALVFLSGLFAPKRLQNFILSLIDKIPFVGSKLSLPIEQAWHMGANKKVIAYALFLSMLIQFGGILSFWILTSPFYDTHVPFTILFSFIPIGLISITLPISPAGLGVGHLVFEGLFQSIGISNGASLFNIVFVFLVCFNFIGLIPYTVYKKPIPEQDLLNEPEEHL